MIHKKIEEACRILNKREQPASNVHSSLIFDLNLIFGYLVGYKAMVSVTVTERNYNLNMNNQSSFEGLLGEYSTVSSVDSTRY